MKDIWHGQDRRMRMMMMMMMMVMMIMMMMIMMKNDDDDDADDADDDDDDDDDRCLWVYLHFLKRYINQCLQIHVIYIHIYYIPCIHVQKDIYIYIPLNTVTHTCVYTHIYIYTYSGINLKNDHKFFRLFHEFLRFDIVCPKVPSLKLTLRMKSYSLSHTTSVFTSWFSCKRRRLEMM